MNTLSPRSFALRTAALCVAALWLAPLSAQQLYKWVDKDGKVHYTDSIPPDAVNQGNKELTKQGRVTKETEAALNEQQRLQREEQQKARQAEAKLYADQKRRDQALLATYTSESDIDVALRRNLEPINGRIKSAEQRMKDVEKKEKQIAEEMEFYQAGKRKDREVKVPPDLLRQQEAAKAEKKTLTDSIAKSEQDIVDLNARFTVDRARWKLLKQGMMPGQTLEKAETKTADAKAADPKATASATPAPAAAPAPDKATKK